MTFVAALRTHLAGLALETGDRQFAVYAGQDPVLPYNVYRIVSRTDAKSLTEAHLAEVQLQIDTYSDNYDQAHEIAEAIRTGLAFFRGTMGGVGGVSIEGSQFEGLEDSLLDPETGLYRVAQSYLIHHAL